MAMACLTMPPQRDRGTRGLIAVYSDHRSLIHLWTDPGASIGTFLLGRIDVDLDGVPDVISCAPDYLNASPQSVSHPGLLGRDGQVLWM